MAAALLRDSPLAAEKHFEDLWEEFMGEMRGWCYDEYDRRERASAEDLLVSFRGWAVGRYSVWRRPTAP